MSKLPPPDFKVRPNPPLPTWMRLMPKGYSSNCRTVGTLPPPNLTMHRDPALVNASNFMRILGSSSAE